MGWVVNATPRPLYPRERLGTHCSGDWVGPSACLDRCGKSRPTTGFDPRTVQPVASRYTDYAIASLKCEVRHQLHSPVAVHCFHPLVRTISCPGIARRVCMLAYYLRHATGTCPSARGSEPDATSCWSTGSTEVISKQGTRVQDFRKPNKFPSL